jgi:hypothetical protein
VTSRKPLRPKAQAACGLVVAASIVLGLTAGENWLLRAIAGALLLLGGLGVFVSIILSPTLQFIGPRLRGANLKLRLTIEMAGRLVFVVLVIFAAPILLYMCADFYGLVKRGSPVRERAMVTYVPGSAIWNWAWKDIGLQTEDGESRSYNLFFHPPYPNQGQPYEVVILPKSKCILSIKPLRGRRKEEKERRGEEMGSDLNI